MMRALLASIALAATVISGAANAEAPATVTGSVSYADLNLSNPAGVAALKGRIRAEANRLCGTETHFLRWIDASQQCKAEVISSAKARLRVAGASSTGGGFPSAN